MSRTSDLQIQTQRSEEDATFNADEIQARVKAITKRLTAQRVTVVFVLTCWPDRWVACDHMKPSLRAEGDTPTAALDAFEANVTAYEISEGALARTLGIAA